MDVPPPSPNEPKELFASTQRLASQFFQTANLSRTVRDSVRHVVPAADPFAPWYWGNWDELAEIDWLSLITRHGMVLITIHSCDDLHDDDLREYVELLRELGRKPELKPEVQELLDRLRDERDRKFPTFLDHAQRLLKRNQVDAALDIIYDQIDEMLLADKLTQVDDLLDALNPSELSLDVLLALLTATLPAKSSLRNRCQFYLRVEQTLRDRGELRDGLLIGLE